MPMKFFKEFESIRRAIADKLLVVGLIVSIPSAITSVYRISTMGFKTLFLLDVLTAIILIAVFVTRSRTDYRKRMILLIGYIFVIGIFALATWGLFGMGITLLLFSTIMLTTLYGVRAGIAAIILSLVTVVAFTSLVHLNLINYAVDFNALSHLASQWLIRLIFFGCLSTIAVATLGFVYKQLEAINLRLSLSEERLNLALDSVNEAVWEINQKDQTTYVSSKFSEILKYAPGEFDMSIEGWRRNIHLDDLEKVDKAIADHNMGVTTSIDVEYRMLNKLGVWQWIQTKGRAVVRDESGKIIRVVGIHTDVSNRKEMERIVVESERKYRLLFQNANDAILIVSRNKVLDANRYAENFFKINRDELIGRNLYELCPTIQSNGIESKESLLNRFNPEDERVEQRFEWEFIRSDGILLETQVTMSQIYQEEHDLYHLLLHDIAIHKGFEQAKLAAIIETEEQERLKFAGDLHDDIGPLLSSLNMYLSLLGRKQTENKDEIIGNMQGILRDAIESVREISNNLSPHVLNTYGLLPALKSLIEPARRMIDLSVNDGMEGVRLPRAIEIVSYRIVKEMINNTLKYSQATSAELSLWVKDNFFNLAYHDNGIGFDLESKLAEKTSGIGLLNIISRLKTLKAHFTLRSKVGEGFHFEMRVRV